MTDENVILNNVLDNYIKICEKNIETIGKYNLKISPQKYTDLLGMIRYLKDNNATYNLQPFKNVIGITTEVSNQEIKDHIINLIKSTGYYARNNLSHFLNDLLGYEINVFENNQTARMEKSLADILENYLNNPSNTDDQTKMSKINLIIGLLNYYLRKVPHIREHHEQLDNFIDFLNDYEFKSVFNKRIMGFRFKSASGESKKIYTLDDWYDFIKLFNNYCETNYQDKVYIFYDYLWNYKPSADSKLEIKKSPKSNVIIINNETAQTISISSYGSSFSPNPPKGSINKADVETLETYIGRKIVLPEQYNWQQLSEQLNNTPGITRDVAINRLLIAGALREANEELGMHLWQLVGGYFSEKDTREINSENVFINTLMTRSIVNGANSIEFKLNTRTNRNTGISTTTGCDLIIKLNNRDYNYFKERYTTKLNGIPGDPNTNTAPVLQKAFPDFDVNMIYYKKYLKYKTKYLTLLNKLN